MQRCSITVEVLSIFSREYTSMKQASYFWSTVGRKQLMAIAGLGLCGFVLMHAIGNIILVFSADAYNKYSHALVTNPLLYAAEAGLVGIFLLHIITGVAVTLRNFKARPEGYAKNPSGDKKTSLITKTMWIQGVIILGFVILHLNTFKYGPEYETTVGGVVMRDLFRLVHEVFQSPLYVAWYVVAVLILCFHLSHGLYSALQTLGANHPMYTPKFIGASIIFGVVVSGMFIVQPLYIFFIYKG
jgi:succinate dehydrogenase / fumarate reductase cytochrome b subunit